MMLSALLGFSAARYQWRFAKTLLVLLPFFAYSLYLAIYLSVFTPSGEGAGVPMLPALYFTLCLPSAVVSVVVFNGFKKA